METVAGFAAVLLWSMAIALIRSIAEKVGPFTSGAIVYLAGGIFLMIRFYVNGESVRKIWENAPLYLFGCAVLFVIYTLSIYLALGLAADASQTLELGIINYLWPVLAILFSLFLLNKSWRWGLIPGMIFALSGTFLVLTHDTEISLASFTANITSNPAAYGLALIAAVSWALYSGLARRWSSDNHAGAVPLFMLVTGTVLLSMRILHPEAGTFDVKVWAEILFLCVSTTIAYVFWDIAMRKGNIVLVLSFSYLAPFFSTLVICFYLRVVPGLMLWLGVFLVVAGSFISFKSVR